MKNETPSSPLTLTEQLIRILLFVIGVSVCCAIVPLFFPLSFMHVLHQFLKLGHAPDEKIFEYLARSLCAMYFAHGVFVIAIASDVRRFRPLVGIVAAINIFLGGALLAIDIKASMPQYWILIEGPPIIGGGIILLTLWWRSRTSR